MRMRIYQVDPKKEQSERYHSELSRVDPSIYTKVLDAEVNVETILDAHDLFTTVDPHPLYSGHAMSCGDVVAVKAGSYIWEGRQGFRKIDFDESRVITKDQIKVLFVQPHEKPYIAEIPNTLEAKQRAVGGYIEYVYNADDTALIGDEEAKIKCKEGNRYLDGAGIIAGDFLIVGLTEEDTRSLSEEEIDKYMEKYSDPPEISQEETDRDVGFAILSF